MTKKSIGILGLVVGLCTTLSFLAAFSVYCFSIYEALTLNGWKGAIVIIPVLGQLLWAGVKFYSVGLFNTYFYLIYITLILFGIASALARLVPPEGDTKEQV